MGWPRSIARGYAGQPLWKRHDPQSASGRRELARRVGVEVGDARVELAARVHHGVVRVDRALHPYSVEQIRPGHHGDRPTEPVLETHEREANAPVVEDVVGSAPAPEVELTELAPAVGTGHGEVDPATEAHLDPGDLARTVEVVVVERHRTVSEQSAVPVDGLLEHRGLLGREVERRGPGRGHRGAEGVGGARGGEERIPHPSPVHRVAVAVGAGLLARPVVADTVGHRDGADTA